MTGCSSDIGATLCKFIAEHSHQAVTTARKPETLSYLPDSLKVLKLALMELEFIGILGVTEAID